MEWTSWHVTITPLQNDSEWLSHRCHGHHRIITSPSNESQLEQLLEVIRDWTERERAEAAKQSFGPTSVLSEAESIECVLLT
jgi:hypothetical protein